MGSQAKVMKHQRLRNGLLTTGLCLFLASCGFQLRGTGGASALPLDWLHMNLLSDSPNSEFTRVLQATFAASGVEWVDLDEADYILRLGPERFSRRNLSVNAAARAAEFDLLMSTDFIVSDKEGQNSMPRTTASVNKQMENDPRNVVGKAEEVRVLRSELRGELAAQVLRRISFFAASTE
jgi:LPS-assembly lipoprotein